MPELEDQVLDQPSDEGVGSGDEPEVREPQPVVDWESIAKQREEDLRKAQAEAEEGRQFRRYVEADQNWQRQEQEKHEETLREQAEVEEYQANLQKINELVSKANKNPGPLGDKYMTAAIKLQRDMTRTEARRELQALVEHLPNLVTSQVMEMVAPNLVGNFIDQQVGVTGVGKAAAALRNKIRSGNYTDQDLADYTAEIAKAVRGQGPAKPNLRAVPGGMGMENADDADATFTSDQDFEKALAARRKRLLQGRG